MAFVYMTYPVNEGKEAAFETAFARILDVMKSAAGHKESHLFRRISSPGEYLIVSEWNDQPAFETFVNSEKFKAGTSDWGKDSIVSGQPTHHFVAG